MKPVRLPALDIQLGGAALDAAVQVTSLRILRALSAPALAEFTASGLMIPPSLGTPMTVDGLGARFVGTVTAVEQAHRQGTGTELTIRACDALHGLKATGQPEALSDMSIGNIAAEIAGRHGLDIDAADDGPVITHLVRTAQSDFEFLTQETRRAGLSFFLDAGTLRIIGAEGHGVPRDISPAADTLETRLETNGHAATGAITVSAVDPATTKTHGALAFGLDAAEGFGPASAEASAELPLFGVFAATADETITLATAEMARRDAARVVLRAIFDGERAPALAQPLTLVDDALAPTVPLVVTRIEHRVDAVAGHIAEISTAPENRVTAPVPRAFWGIVTDAADPSGAGRLRCSLPQYGDVDTSWLQVVRPLAGPGRGWVSLPTRGDTVYIHAPSGRPEHGVVLGAVPGTDALAIDAEGGQRTGLVTGAGHRLIFDDTTDEATLEVPDGSRCAFGPQGVTLSAAGDLTLEAPGRRVTIRGDRIEFERG